MQHIFTLFKWTQFERRLLTKKFEITFGAIEYSMEMLKWEACFEVFKHVFRPIFWGTNGW